MQVLNRHEKLGAVPLKQEQESLESQVEDRFECDIISSCTLIKF